MRVAFVGGGAIVLFDITAMEVRDRDAVYDRAGNNAKGLSVRFCSEAQFRNVTAGFGGSFHRPNSHTQEISKIFFLVVRSQSSGGDGKE